MPGILSVGVPKLAVACLLERLLNPTHASKWSPIILYGLSISCNLFGILCAILFWVQCRPAAALWDPLLKSNCWNPSIYNNIAIVEACNIISTCSQELLYLPVSVAYFALVDLYLALYPATILFKLQMSMKNKACCSLALGLGVM